MCFSFFVWIFSLDSFKIEKKELDQQAAELKATYVTVHKTYKESDERKQWEALMMSQFGEIPGVKSSKRKAKVTKVAKAAKVAKIAKIAKVEKKEDKKEKVVAATKVVVAAEVEKEMELPKAKAPVAPSTFFSPTSSSSKSTTSTSSSSSSSSIAAATTTTSSSSSSSSKKSTTSTKKSGKTSLAAIGKYHPINDAGWKEGEAVPYKCLVASFTLIEATTKRLEITAILVKLFRSVIALTPKDLIATVYLTCNKLAPEYAGVEIGLGDATLKKALQSSMGTNIKHISKKYEELGDLGLVALQLAKSKRSLFGFKTKPLTVVSVLEKFRTIANTSGTGSEAIKMGQISKMLSDAKNSEAKYLIRGLQGKLRIGLAEQTVLKALSQAIAITPSSTLLDSRHKKSTDKIDAMIQKAEDCVKQAYSECPSYDKLCTALLEGGIDELQERCHLCPGIPVKPMLAKPTKGVGEVLKRLEGIKFTCEWKYDGERGQVHLLPDGSFRVFSRNSEDNTKKYPDIIDMFPQTIRYTKEGSDEVITQMDSDTKLKSDDAKTTSTGIFGSSSSSSSSVITTRSDGMKPMVTSFIMDSEVIAIDRETGRLLPFQILSTRARKGTALDDVKVQVIMTAFDLLFLNGRSLLKEPLSERRRLLKSHFQEVDGKFDFAKHKEGGSLEEIEVYLDEAIKGNTEGLMVKTLDENATYEPSKRSLNWLKLKKDYLEGLGDTLDLVPIGAYYGRGKRTGTYGAYLLACYNDEDETYQTTCKIGTGFSDVQLTEFTKYFNEEDRQVTKRPSDYQVHEKFDTGPNAPDVWFKPSVVWEVKAADLSISPVHTSAFGVEGTEKGIALRFPRLERVRTDKGPTDCTTAEQVEQMFHDQDNRN